MGYKEERDHVVNGLSTHGRLCRVCWTLALIFAILGIVAAAAKIDLGLGATNWLLLALVICGLGIMLMVFWAAGMYLHVIEGKSKKEE